MEQEKLEEEERVRKLRESGSKVVLFCVCLCVCVFVCLLIDRPFVSLFSIVRCVNARW